MTETEKKYRREYLRKWRTQVNPARYAEYMREWRARNRERINEQQRANRTKNRESLNARRRMPEARSRAAAARRDWAARNPDRAMAYHYRYRYGIEPRELAALVERQGGVCAICKGKPRSRRGFHIDHDHATGKIRGVLCHHCNTAIGLLRESPTLLRCAAEYLEREVPELPEPQLGLELAMAR